MARGLAVAVVALLVAAAPAGAASGTYNCANLQTGLNQVEDGDVITVDGMCTGQYTFRVFPSPGPAESYKSWTLQGSGGDDGFDRNSVPGRALTGNDSHRVVIQGLTFRDSRVTGPAESGGAVELTGETGAQFFNNSFFNNHAPNRGGAIHMSPETPPSGFNNLGFSALGNTFGSATEGNSAVIGGAISVETPGVNDQFSLTDNLFTGNSAAWDGGAFDFELAQAGAANVSLGSNRVIDNTAGGSGGGGHLIVGATFLNVSDDLYEGNSIEQNPDGPQGDHRGAGLYVLGDDSLFTLRDSVFRNNTINAVPGGNSYGGGGLALIADGMPVESSYNRFEGNSVAGQPDADFESEGGAVFVSNPAGRWYGFLDAIAGNSVGALGEGGGMYVGASADMLLELGEVTVAHNTVGVGGQGAGLAGGGFDDLIVRNSTIWNEPNYFGFDSLDVTYSDMCQNGRGGPVPGEGNICADPLLVSTTDVHQTKLSPTIDRGNDAYLDDEGGGERNMEDYEGDARPTDGDGDGHTTDMGADETPADFAKPAPVVPAQTPPQCSDQVDNDGDGAIDAADPGCLAGPTDNNEGDESLQDVFLCGQRTISLVRADARGRRVVLSGIVARSVAGQKVDLFVRYLGRRGRATKVATVTPGADGQFRARVKGPPRNLFNKARYRATVAGSRSVELKLPQSLASSSLRQIGGMLELRGQVDRKLLGKRNVVVVKRILCASYTTVGQARPDRRGRYVVRFPAPTTGGSALYRAESRVLARPRSKRYVRQFARAIGITF
jgi:hypothetical protein